MSANTRPRLTDSPEYRRAKALKANAVRNYGADSAEAEHHAARLRAVMAESWARELVERVPDLDTETRHRLARILLGDFDPPNLDGEPVGYRVPVIKRKRGA